MACLAPWLGFRMWFVRACHCSVLYHLFMSHVVYCPYAWLWGMLCCLVCKLSIHIHYCLVYFSEFMHVCHCHALLLRLENEYVLNPFNMSEYGLIFLLVTMLVSHILSAWLAHWVISNHVYILINLICLSNWSLVQVLSNHLQFPLLFKGEAK